MSSQINPYTIDSSYPVPGVNNSSQGLRSNFSAIQKNFQETQNEINDLINKVIVSAPLTYGSNSSINNFGGMYNSNLSLFDFGLKVWNNGSISNPTTISMDFSKGPVQLIQLTGSALQTQNINLINFPSLGYSEIFLIFSSTNTPQYINFSSLSPNSSFATHGNFPINGLNLSTGIYTLSTTYPITFKISSYDGLTWTIEIPSATASIRNYTPSSSIGASGDTQGALAYDSNYIYICNGNYDGTTHIWNRIATSAF